MFNLTGFISQHLTTKGLTLKKLGFFLVFIFNAHALLAMENPEGDDHWRKQITSQCNNYQLYLPKQYACICTKGLHMVFGTQTRQDEIKKLKKLDELLLDLKQDRKMTKQQVILFICEEIGPFYDQYGENFFECCTSILIKDLRWPECVVCYEDKARSVFIPCGHAVSCTTCVKKLQKANNKILCPICKSGVDKLLPLASLKDSEHCVSCLQEKPNVLYLTCNHKVHCNTCAKGICPICKKNSNFIKVYFDDK